jgi:RNA polymerase sigma-70 factor (ECF subfamily)
MAAPAFSVPNPNAARLADPALREALLKYARRRLPPGEVEDLVQNTLTEALVSPNAPTTDSEFQRWVHGIARHKVVDSYRRQGRSPLLDAELDAKPCEVARGTGELEQWIESELPNTEGARATLHWLLRENDGESLDEIARDAALPAPRVRQRVSRLRRHFHARWLALGAAGLALLLGAGLLFHFVDRASSHPPVIAREPVSPLDQAHGLRKNALERCAAGAFQECVSQLDEAKLLDPTGDAADAVQAARSAAARAAEPAPTPSAPESKSTDSKARPLLAPKQLTTRLPRKAAPKQLAPKPAQKPSSNLKSFPSKKGGAPLRDPSSDEYFPPLQQNVAPPEAVRKP